MASTAQGSQESHGTGLTSYLTQPMAWALALGTSVGWGSLVITSTTYLAQAGPAGSVIGILVGMAIMVVIALCYHFLMSGERESAGGIYAFARDLFGYDHAALIAWFMILIYFAMLWANATSLQLFTRFFCGGLFQFGFHYELFGYDVYFGEALLSIAAVAAAGAACMASKRGIGRAVVAMCGVIVVGVTVCFACSMVQRDAATFPLKPAFIPGSSPLAQVLTIASISSWAFIGFESISCSTTEFAFDRSRTLRILVVALVSATALYVFLTLLSVSAYPPQYDSWVSYIADLPNQSGVAAIPAFYAATHYLGDAGYAVLVAVLLCLVVTSLFGNIIALSRLIHAIAADGVLPERLRRTSRDSIPTPAIALVVGVSCLIPFLGRTAIGWVVDVTTLGATLVYGFTSVCAVRDGKRRGRRLEHACGVVGIALMALFGASLLLPTIFDSDAMATESYAIFTAWSVLGFAVLRYLLQKDTQRRFGHSIFAWLTLLVLVLCMSAAWMGKIAGDASAEALATLHAVSDPAQTMEVAEVALASVTKAISNGALVIALLCIVSLAVMLSNFTVVVHREETSFKTATVAHEAANTDPLTGVRSKHAFVSRETELNMELEDGTLSELGVVVCDVNGLKVVNDTLGHKAGDEYIRSAAMLICRLFRRCEVYRIGGDEFCVLLTGEDYVERNELMARLNETVEANRDAGEVVVAAGIATFVPDMDRQVHDVFERADASMYLRKRELKRPGEEIR